MPPEPLTELPANLTAPTQDMHRALQALAGHLSTLDHCNQRLDACTDPSLLTVLGATRDAERQQIAMLLEWLRRHDPKLDLALRAALFKAGPIVPED